MLVEPVEGHHAAVLRAVDGVPGDSLVRVLLGDARVELAVGAADRGLPVREDVVDLDDAVYAFQKVQGLPRTGIVSPAVWARLDHPSEPRPRYPGPAAHIEVDKTRQVLYVVRGGRIRTIVPVSTAGVPGDYTPTGRFAIYRKVPGYDPSPLGILYKPMYFVGVDLAWASAIRLVLRFSTRAAGWFISVRPATTPTCSTRCGRSSRARAQSVSTPRWW